MPTYYAIKVWPILEDERAGKSFYVRLQDISYPSLPLCDLVSRERASLFEDYAQAFAIAESYTDQDYLDGGRCFNGYEIEAVELPSADGFTHAMLASYIAEMKRIAPDPGRGEQVLESLKSWLFASKRKMRG